MTLLFIIQEKLLYNPQKRVHIKKNTHLMHKGSMIIDILKYIKYGV